ncbi:DNA cytosine methyltransferase [Oricola thermophila]|uniref:DNA cytosine methyltransferase n=1 Tax=Oricola thermophila TaxID=2742145 RepID=UPI0018D903AA|nr:DNA (cytosine-5-)-methyltransferase [Oricola thermophila]
MSKLKVLDLFSGIGGFSLGLERTGGFETVAFCEIEDYPRRVLKKHWPDVRIYDDVRELTGSRLAADGITRVDVITAGFPCQDISIANGVWGKRLGLRGERSGLFHEACRLLGDLRPFVVIFENVRELLRNGLLEMLKSLASLGYDAEWHAIPASYVGSLQNRDRVWVIAYPREIGIKGLFEGRGVGKARQGWTCCQADLPRIFAAPLVGDSWPQPIIRRGSNRPAYWVDRIAACGNAVVPQIPEMIGYAILDAIEGEEAAA